VSRSSTPQERKYWEKMHFENCSAGRSMEKNLGCPGYKKEGNPLFQQTKEKKLYQQPVRGRKVI
jgi:hypothetical protein